MNYILVLGAQHSGTSLLTAILGGHPEIAMLNEDLKGNITKVVGKKYAGNKLIYHLQVRKSTKANRFTHLANRIVRFLSPTIGLFKRPFPNSEMSLDDYLELEPKIILMERDLEKNIESICRRESVSEKLAEEYLEKVAEIPEILPEGIDVHKVDLQSLTEDPKDTVAEICDFLDLEFKEEMLSAPKYGYKYKNEYGSKIVQKE
ncbi:MAG TPA: hypothetical protein VIN73_03355 [Vicingaceae bacterium]